MRFQVGDRVAIDGGHYHCFSRDEVGVIVTTYPEASTPPHYTVRVGDTEQFVYEKDLRVPGPRRLHEKD